MKKSGLNPLAKSEKKNNMKDIHVNIHEFHLLSACLIHLPFLASTTHPLRSCPPSLSSLPSLPNWFHVLDEDLTSDIHPI